jgi:hypothetical protein
LGGRHESEARNEGKGDRQKKLTKILDPGIIYCCLNKLIKNEMR